MYFVYLLLCDDDSIYTGITVNVEDRLRRHKNGSGAKYTRARKAVRVLYTEQHNTRQSAAKREAQIKGWKREKKLELISSSNQSV
ncbi:endonuclease [Candidatus Uhrbacteria bacterium CG10_big_fil_rev_8_21_14_0_10_48_11]|uniref:Endonuclease n=1 Tax=Candidatus Uhrbacteria bacterium CG10_big_fil_rev_8_21_14_0_10_48_11 TaxID=1975037 RepID=A0A2M8LEX0_9BACT|nr:MAG: endonuclease [Candidatus Uhrbacteria bacterium CG10_big_fil_rev_8_21_14_0_10_48_11]